MHTEHQTTLPTTVCKATAQKNILDNEFVILIHGTRKQASREVRSALYLYDLFVESATPDADGCLTLRTLTPEGSKVPKLEFKVKQHLLRRANFKRAGMTGAAAYIRPDGDPTGAWVPATCIVRPPAPEDVTSPVLPQHIMVRPEVAVSPDITYQVMYSKYATGRVKMTSGCRLLHVSGSLYQVAPPEAEVEA